MTDNGKPRSMPLERTPYWYHQVSKFSILAAYPQPRPLIALLGDSLTEGFSAEEFLPNYHFANRGISGDVSEAVLLRLKESILDLHPEVVFLLIGTNDLALGYSNDQIVQNIDEICIRIRRSLPDTHVVLQSLLPTRSDVTRPNSRIQAINVRLERNAELAGVRFFDLHALFSNESGDLGEAYSLDGLHLNGPAYAKWAKALDVLIQMMSPASKVPGT